MLGGSHVMVSFNLGPLTEKQGAKLRGLADLKAVGIAKLQQCSLVVVPEVQGPRREDIRMPCFVLLDGFIC